MFWVGIDWVGNDTVEIDSGEILHLIVHMIKVKKTNHKIKIDKIKSKFLL